MTSEPQETEPPRHFGESCCGDEIRTTVLGRQRKAWVACGDALEHFETKIMPHVGPIIRNVDLGDVDLYLRLYMVGKTKQTVSPMIAVICSDVTVANNSKKALKSSSLLVNDHPSFNVGRFPRPLGHSTQIRPLAADKQTVTKGDFNFNFYNEPTLLSTTNAPTIGRPLILASETSRYATAGVITYLREVDQYFQLTAGHLFDTDESADLSQPPTQDEDACSFDGQSDEDEENETDPRSQEDSLSFASRSSCGDDDDFLDNDSIFSNPVPPIEIDITSYQKPGYLTDHNTRIKSIQADPKGLVEAGSLSLHSRDGGNPQLDYAMIAIDRPRLAYQGKLNVLNFRGNRLSSDSLHIGKIATPKLGTKTPILAVTTSGDVTNGLIMPGAIYLRKPHVAQFQALYVVQLNGPLEYGDSGSVVVDRTSGDLYGHITSGCSSANTAYIVPARDVFDDINGILNSRSDPLLPGTPSEVTSSLQLCGKVSPSSSTSLIRDNSSLESVFMSDGNPTTEDPARIDSHTNACSNKNTAELCQLRKTFWLSVILMSLHLLPLLGSYADSILLSSISNISTLFFDGRAILTVLYWLPLILTSICLVFVTMVTPKVLDLLLHWAWTTHSKHHANGRSPHLTLPSFASWSRSCLALPFFTLLFGSLLKFQLDFEYHFIPTTPETNISVDFPYPDYYGIVSSLLGNNLFTNDDPIPDCTENCTTLFLSPSFDSVATRYCSNALEAGWGLHSMMTGTDAVRIRGAPGYIIELRSLDSHSWEFDFDNECSEFDLWADGRISLVVCSKQVGESVETGVALHSTSLSSVDRTPWISLSRITAYSAPTSIVYDTNDARILDARSTSVPYVRRINASSYRETFNQVLPVAKASNLQDDSAMLARDGSLLNLRYFDRWTIDLAVTSWVLDCTAIPRSLLAFPIRRGLDDDSGNLSTLVISAQGGKFSNRLLTLRQHWWSYASKIPGFLLRFIPLVLSCRVLWMALGCDGPGSPIP